MAVVRYFLERDRLFEPLRSAAGRHLERTHHAKVVPTSDARRLIEIDQPIDVPQPGKRRPFRRRPRHRPGVAGRDHTRPLRMPVRRREPRHPRGHVRPARGLPLHRRSHRIVRRREAAGRTTCHRGRGARSGGVGGRARRDPHALVQGRRRGAHVRDVQLLQLLLHRPEVGSAPGSAPSQAPASSPKSPMNAAPHAADASTPARLRRSRSTARALCASIRTAASAAVRAWEAAPRAR